jgi:hypothetical protein
LRNLHAGPLEFYAIDTFSGHSCEDLPHGTEGLHHAGLFGSTDFGQVVERLREYPFARVIQGRIQDCRAEIPRQPMHFVHIDVDIFEPTYFALKLFAPLLVPGGILCIDDYNKTSCPGVRDAVERLLAEEPPGAFVSFYTQTAQCLLIRTRSA